MRTSDLTKKSRDEIGMRMLKAIRASDDKLDRIVAKNTLFDPIRDAVGDDLIQEYSTFSVVKAAGGIRPWQVAMLSICGFLLVAASLIYLVRQNDSGPRVVVNDFQKGPSFEDTQSPTDRDDEPSFVPEPGQISEHKRPPRKRGLPVRYSVRPRPRQEVEEVGEFQSLPYTEKVSTVNPTGQIARVELPRSSLFAMGIALPFENPETTKVKVDLLIGEDGVMRAIRIIKPVENK
jgi:hypothetical protein